MDARADEKKLRAAAEGPEFARHACNPRSALPGRLVRQSCERRGATFVDRLGHLRRLAAQDVGEPGAERTQKAHRIDAVADDEFPGRILLQSQAIDFVPRKSSDFGHYVPPKRLPPADSPPQLGPAFVNRALMPPGMAAVWAIGQLEMTSSGQIAGLDVVVGGNRPAPDVANYGVGSSLRLTDMRCRYRIRL